MTCIKELLSTARNSYRNARMHYDLGSEDFRFKINLFAIASVVTVAALCGLYAGG